jgi:proline iminopeptidase
MIFMIHRPRPRRYHAAMPLYPDAALLHRHTLAVGHGHEIAVHEHGAAHGITALVLHGGPGSGCTPLLRRFFDPQRYRLVCIDQRGAGASRPRGGVEHNTTADLLADLRAVRRHLGIERWLVVGGSWGATLALAHAADDSRAVAALLLRASFLARAEDIAAFFDGSQADGSLPSLARALHAGSAAEQQRAALAWWRREQTLSGTHAPDPDGDALAALVDRYRVQSHYLVHGCFLADEPLLQRCTRVPPVPTLLLHGREDRVCRPEGAVALQRALPHARLRWIDGAGHDPTHPGMAGAMVDALDAYARHAAFGEEGALAAHR